MQLDDFNGFNVFKVARLTQQHPLATVTMALLQRYDLVAKLSLPLGRVTSFLQVRCLNAAQSGRWCCLHPVSL